MTPQKSADTGRTLYLVDGHSQVFKAYHAIRQLSTSTGIPTNAVYGFLQILHKLLRTRSPQYMAVVFDSGGATFRHEMYTEYKANRLAPPDDFAQQMDYILKIVEGLRIPILREPGFEADDLIATMTRKAEKEGFHVVIVTADKDLFQLVNDRVTVLRLEPDAETEFTREAVKEKMGVYPEQIGDYLAIVGDSSDNVPGIRGVGPKGAITLLEKYGNLQAILEHAHELKGKQAEYVAAGRESALLSRQLVDLRTDAPVSIETEQLKRQPPDVAALQPLYRELEFRRFLEELQLEPEDRTCDYRIITDLKALEEYCAQVMEAGVVAIDTETDGLQPLEAKLAGISMSITPDSGVYVPVGHVDAVGNRIEPQLTLDQVREVLGPVLASPKVRKVGHNLKFDWKVLRQHGLDLDRAGFDTLIASFILNPDRRNHGLKDLAGDLLGIRMTRIDELIGSGRKMIPFSQVDLEKGGRYSCADADVTLQLYRLLDQRLDEAAPPSAPAAPAQPDDFFGETDMPAASSESAQKSGPSPMRRLFEEIELPLIPVLMEMETTGVCIDPEVFAELSSEMRARLADIRERIYKAAGREFNLGSPRQLAQVLFEELKLKPTKTKKTQFSTDAEVLEELASEHEVPRLMVEHRQYEKLLSTYVDVLPQLRLKSTGRIHTTFNQAVAATGRLSSSDPNLQNIPVRTAEGRKIRSGFIPCEPGRLLLSADYSQIELRVLAHVTHDPSLVQAYRENIDVHRLTASKIFKVTPEEVSPEQRDVGKTINFGVIYGMSAPGLASRLKIPMAEARTFIEEYFAAYAGVRAWLDSTLEFARTHGYVETVSGRRRYLPDIRSRNFNARSAAERVATNAPIQGTSADMIKIAMIRVADFLRREKAGTKMILQVHDELIFDMPEEEVDVLTPEIIRIMQEALPLDVPVEVEAHAGRNWGEC